MVVFFQPQIEFRTQTNIFQENFFCMQNLKNCQKIKVCYFCCMNCERQVVFQIQVVAKFRSFSMQMKDRPTFGVLSKQGLCQLCSVANTTEYFSEIKFIKNKSKFLVIEKIPIIQFSYMDKCLS